MSVQQFPANNAEFLAAIFGSSARPVERPTVCAFAGTHAGRWNGWPWAPGAVCDDPDLNWYFTLAVHRPNAAGAWRRKVDQCAAIYGIMLDDIGTKAAPRSRLDSLPPSVLIETSAGNFQALYLFDKPVTDIALVTGLQNAVIAAGLCDEGANGPAARYGRMPYGVNDKYTPPQVCRLVEWRPDLRYAIEEIASGLQLPEVKPAPPRERVVASTVEWDAKTPQQQAETIDDLRSALAVIPSDDRDTWVCVGHYLRTLPDPISYELFEEWSRKSEDFDEDGLDQFWTFNPTDCSYRSVFASAGEKGWVNPRSRAAVDPSTVGFGMTPLPPGATANPPAPSAPPFVRVNIADLNHAPPKQQAWWCESYVPAEHVTLLGGHGGLGKSTLALMLSACIASGLPFMGLQVRRGRVLFFSAEDPGSLVRRRLVRVCREFQIDPAELAQALHVLDATEAAPVLYAEQRNPQGMRAGATTATYRALAEYVTTNAIDVVIIDNSSDAFDGDEINRAMVRGFIRNLALLIRGRGGAVVLLAHVDKMTSRAGKSATTESYSGSTAWHNSVRSRLFLLERGPGVLELQHQKSNLGQRRGPLVLEWTPDKLPKVLGAPVPGGEPTPADADLRAILALIIEFYERGEFLAPATNSPSNAFSMLKNSPTFPAHQTRGAVAELLREAQRRQLLKTETYRGPDRHGKTRWAVTPQGQALAAGSAGSAGST